ncbi:hypothetical protein H7F15_19125 [Pontibacter sp. Tf4]|uniref:hypothetical protein n=1 Tax=Pontibacter sp. Tf4 TaxID=2761620 RepID=UPI00162515E8|nr:hypothetical protein [Pontibacter sp. Tf4]MBB6613160.1 hypothetical protein [Pontibacter sp. Tf4]
MNKDQKLVLKILGIIFLIVLVAGLSFVVWIRSHMPRSEALDQAIETITESKKIRQQVGEVVATEYLIDDLPDPELDSVKVKFEILGSKDTVGVQAIVVKIFGDWKVLNYSLD